MPPQNQPTSQTPQQSPERTPVGPTVGIVIIILVLLLGALYFWGQQLNSQESNAPSYIPGDTQTGTGIDVSVGATTTIQ